MRLDLNSFIGLGLVLANLRFDSPVLVIAATASVIILVIRTVVGYLNARVSWTHCYARVSRVIAMVSKDNGPLEGKGEESNLRDQVRIWCSVVQCGGAWWGVGWLGVGGMARYGAV